MTGPRGSQPQSPKPISEEAVLSDEEVQRRINVEGGGQLQAPPPEHKFRDRRPTPPAGRRREGTGGRDSLLLIGLVVVGLLAVGVLLPDGPLTSSATNPPSVPGTIGAVVATAPASPAASRGGLITLPPGPSTAATPVPATAVPTPRPPAVTSPPAGAPTARPTPTPNVTPKPTRTPAPPTPPTTATLLVRFDVVNNDGGTRPAGSWTVTVDSAGSESPASFAGSSTGTLVTISANAAYSVSTDAASGYTSGFSADCSSASGGLPAPGSSQTCTISENDIKPRVLVQTVVDNTAGGTQAASDWTVAVSGTDVAPSSFAGSTAGVYVRLDANAGFSVSMSNANDAGYDPAVMTGTCSDPGWLWAPT